MNKAGIYKIVDKEGRIYIGQAKDIEKRWYNHKNALEKGKHHSKFMQRVYSKHGLDYFTFSVIVYCAVENLDTYEQACLDMLFNNYTQDYIFNGSPTAQSPLGVKRSEETKRKMSIARTGSIPKVFISPLGKAVSVYNLLQFCRDNNLSAAHMWQVYKGIRNHHKGWRKAVELYDKVA